MVVVVGACSFTGVEEASERNERTKESMAARGTPPTLRTLRQHHRNALLPRAREEEEEGKSVTYVASTMRNKQLASSQHSLSLTHCGGGSVQNPSSSGVYSA